MPSACSAASIGGSTMSTPSGMSATPSPRRMSAISARCAGEQPDLWRDRAAQADHAAADVLGRQPRAVQPVVLGGRAEVPQVRLAAAGQQREARHLVARPLADVGAGDVADVVEVEEQQGAEVGGSERLAGAAEAVVAQPRRCRPAPPSRRSWSRVTPDGRTATAGRSAFTTALTGIDLRVVRLPRSMPPLGRGFQ